MKTGQVAVDLGKSFNKVAEIRLIADYSDEEVSADRGVGCQTREGCRAGHARSRREQVVTAGTSDVRGASPGAHARSAPHGVMADAA